MRLFPDIHDPEEIVEYHDRLRLLSQLMTEKLSPRQERVMRMRMGWGCRPMFQSEIAELFGLSVPRIQQVELKAVQRIIECHQSVRLSARQCTLRRRARAL